MMYLRDASVWDHKQGDNPRPQHLFFGWDRSKAAARTAGLKALLVELRPLSMITPEEAAQEAGAAKVAEAAISADAHGDVAVKSEPLAAGESDSSSLQASADGSAPSSGAGDGQGGATESKESDAEKGGN